MQGYKSWHPRGKAGNVKPSNLGEEFTDAEARNKIYFMHLLMDRHITQLA